MSEVLRHNGHDIKILFYVEKDDSYWVQIVDEVEGPDTYKISKKVRERLKG